MDTPRFLTSRLQTRFNSFPVVVVSGARTREGQGAGVPGPQGRGRAFSMVSSMSRTTWHWSQSAAGLAQGTPSA